MQAAYVPRLQDHAPCSDRASTQLDMVRKDRGGGVEKSSGTAGGGSNPRPLLRGGHRPEGGERPAAEVEQEGLGRCIQWDLAVRAMKELNQGKGLLKTISNPRERGLGAPDAQKRLMSRHQAVGGSLAGPHRRGGPQQVPRQACSHVAPVGNPQGVLSRRCALPKSSRAVIWPLHLVMAEGAAAFTAAPHPTQVSSPCA